MLLKWNWGGGICKDSEAGLRIIERSPHIFVSTNVVNMFNAPLIVFRTQIRDNLMKKLEKDAIRLN